MQDAIKNIAETSQKTWTKSVEPCAGALGIHANFTFAKHKIINDYDQHKVNLYNVVKQYPDKLYFEISLLPVTQNTFTEIKGKMENDYTTLDTSKVNIDAAVCFLYLNLTSFKNLGDIFNDKYSLYSYRKKLSAIFPLHDQLKDTDIYGLDIFDILKAHMNDADTILIVDPPYLDADVYTANMTFPKNDNSKQNNESKQNNDSKQNDDSKQKKFGYNEHKKLAKLLYTAVHKHHNDFIYFCRITASRKQKQTEEMKNKLKAADNHMLGRIDDLYRNKGFYYQDIEYDAKGTIERIITSFPFEGSTPYGMETASDAKGVK